jgi:hypothetical protein
MDWGLINALLPVNTQLMMGDGLRVTGLRGYGLLVPGRLAAAARWPLAAVWTGHTVSAASPMTTAQDPQLRILAAHRESEG